MSCHGCPAPHGKQEHCVAPGCHQTFSGTTAGDMHRVGKHHVSTGPDRRRCMTEAEMLARGMTRNSFGIWMCPGPDMRAA